MADQQTSILHTLKEYKQIFQNKYGDWVDEARKAASFVRGSHFTEGQDTASAGSDDDEAPEELGGSRRIYPNVPYLPSRIDRLIQYVRHDEATPQVEPEEPFDFQVPPEHPWNAVRDKLRQMFGDLTDNELTAKLLTARLDLFRDRARIDELLDEVLEVAAQERCAAVVVNWFEDEATREGVHTTLLRVGEFWFDPAASKVNQGRFCGYVERNVRKEEVAKRYGTDIQQEGTDKDQRNATQDDKGLIDVNHWWIRDTAAEAKPVMAQVEAIAPDGTVAVIEQQALDENGKPKTEDVYKYTGGWRYVCVTHDQILQDGNGPSYNGAPTMLVMPWRKMPRSIMGLSVVDMAKDYNKAMDRLQQYALEASYKQQPKTIVNKKALVNPEQLYQNTVAGFVDAELKEGSTLQDAFFYAAGGNPPAGIMEQFGLMVQRADEMTGAQGIQIEEASKTKLSGDAIEGLAQDREGVAGRVKDNWYWFLRDYYTLVINTIIQNQTESQSVKLVLNGKPVFIQAPMQMFQFDGYDFEARFDVVVAAPRNLPRNPVRRAQYLKAVLGDVVTMASTDPMLARLYVEVADLPHTARVIEYLDQYEAKIGQNSEQAGDPAARQKMAMDMAKTQQENELAVKRRAIEAMSDSLERIVTEQAKTDPQGAAVLAMKIPTIVMQAWNTGNMDLSQHIPQQQPELTPALPVPVPMAGAMPAPEGMEQEGTMEDEQEDELEQRMPNV